MCFLQELRDVKPAGTKTEVHKRYGRGRWWNSIGGTRKGKGMFKAVMLIKVEVMPREWRKGRKKEEKTHRGTVHVCVPVCAATKVVRSVKRNESDQRRDKTMEEARQRQAVVGGTDEAAEALCTLYLYSFTLFLWQYFSFMISSPFFSFFFCSCTHPPTHQRSAQPLHLPSTAIKDAVTLCLAASFHYILCRKGTFRARRRRCRCRAAFCFSLICWPFLTNEWVAVEAAAAGQQGSLNVHGFLHSCKGTYLHNSCMIADLLALLLVCLKR